MGQVGCIAFADQIFCFIWFFFSSRRRHTRCALVTGVQTCALPICPSAAQSRWEVQSLASAPLEANAPGGPAMEIELLRHRAGLAGRSWRVGWDRERLCFREPALPRAWVPFPFGRPAALGIDKRCPLSA